MISIKMHIKLTWYVFALTASTAILQKYSDGLRGTVL